MTKLATALIVPEQRRSTGIRRDINDLVRGDDGKISGGKIGTYAGQFLAGRALYFYIDDLIDHWDSLLVMFAVLIAPEMLKALIRWKYSGGVPGGEGTVSQTDTMTSTRKVSKP